ncbi:MAG: hypothetical protein ACQETH_11350 [Candidatus Rifleibacteriota bacterium]
MLLKNKFFIGGAMLSVFIASLFCRLPGIQASNNQADKYIKFAQQKGLFDSTAYSRKTLKKPVSEMAFYRSLTQIMSDLGFLETYNLTEMREAGIISQSKIGRYIKRDKAFKTIFRALMFAANRTRIKIGNRDKKLQPFYDWVIPQKYLPAFGFAIEEGIITGTPDGRIMPDKKLSIFETLLLLHRIHESFIDTHKVKTKQPRPIRKVNKTFQTLKKAGAFDLTSQPQVMLKQESISIKQVSAMIHGILANYNKSAYISELKYYTGGIGKSEKASRANLTHLASILARALPHQKVGLYSLYKDVKSGSRLARSLGFLSRANIRLGYDNNFLKGEEIIKPSEAFDLIREIIIKSDKAALHFNRVATQNDVNDFINRIKARKARIRKILARSSQKAN